MWLLFHITLFFKDRDTGAKMLARLYWQKEIVNHEAVPSVHSNAEENNSGNTEWITVFFFFFFCKLCQVLIY